MDHLCCIIFPNEGMAGSPSPSETCIVSLSAGPLGGTLWPSGLFPYSVLSWPLWHEDEEGDPIWNSKSDISVQILHRTLAPPKHYAIVQLGH